MYLFLKIAVLLFIWAWVENYSRKHDSKRINEELKKIP